MTQLLALHADARAKGREPGAILLSREHERMLRESASDTFGAQGATAASEGESAWRSFLAWWFENRIAVSVSFGAAQTRIE